VPKSSRHKPRLRLFTPAGPQLWLEERKCLGKEESLRNLIESRSARQGMAPRDLWRLTLRAMKDEALLPVLPNDQSLDTRFNQGGMWITWKEVFNGVLKDIDRYLPTHDFWTISVRLDPDKFDEWLASPQQAGRLPARRLPTYDKIKQAVANYVEGQRKQGRNTSIPSMFEYLKQHLPEATRAQGERALKDIEGGSKRRGRPRTRQ
jgi:hypothetical protein